MLSRPSRDEICLQVAGVVSQRSTCNLAQVGVVIARDGRILSTGYNGAPAGMDHCSHDRGWTDSPTCDLAVHAEANAIAYAARWGIGLEGATLYSTHQPCINCAKLVVNSGIVEVHGVLPYRDDKGITLLTDAGLTFVRSRVGVQFG